MVQYVSTVHSPLLFVLVSLCYFPAGVGLNQTCKVMFVIDPFLTSFFLVTRSLNHLSYISLLHRHSKHLLRNTDCSNLSLSSALFILLSLSCLCSLLNNHEDVGFTCSLYYTGILILPVLVRRCLINVHN